MLQALQKFIALPWRFEIVTKETVTSAGPIYSHHISLYGGVPNNLVSFGSLGDSFIDFCRTTIKEKQFRTIEINQADVIFHGTGFDSIFDAAANKMRLKEYVFIKYLCFENKKNPRARKNLFSIMESRGLLDLTTLLSSLPDHDRLNDVFIDYWGKNFVGYSPEVDSLAMKVFLC
jgi:hypothetical protein